MGITAAVMAGFALAPLVPLVQRIFRGHSGWLLALLPGTLFLFFVQQLQALPPDGLTVRHSWVPSLGLELALRADGLSLLMAQLITGLGALVFAYGGAYLAGDAALGRFYVVLLVFMAAMLGLVLAENLLALFVFWELTSVSSYLLIGYDHRRAAVRSAALQALLVTGGGGLAMMAGFLLLGQVGGTYSIVELAAQADAVHGSSLYLPLLILVLLGAFTKSAQFPFHFWLPGAMEAPAPVSAYLHSATMVKAGVYLLARLTPILGGTDGWFYLVTGVGTVTMVAGAVLGVRQTDLKRVLAYSTISALGLMVLLIGVGSEASIRAALLFLLAHALYKGALFLVIGSVDHATGTREVDHLGGLARAMPMTAAAALLAAASMAGLPPWFGFIAKEHVLEAALHSPERLVLTGCVLLASALFVTMALLAGVRPFWGAATKTPHKAHEASPAMWLAPALLAALSLGLAFWPRPIEAIVPQAVAAVLGRTEVERLSLEIFHGFNLPLALSAGAIVVGIGLYLARKPLRTFPPGSVALENWGPARWYAFSLAALGAVASWQTRVLQSGVLRHYLAIFALANVALTGYALVTQFGLVWPYELEPIRYYDAALCALVMIGSLAAVAFKSRLAALASLGIVGYGVALLFVVFAAPDLAMTQFLIETLTVILFVLVFYHLPKSEKMPPWPIVVRNGAVAASVGVLMAALVLAANYKEFKFSVADYYLLESLPGGHGANVVNVILVDFRALDTLGEISVLAIAAVGVYGLLKLRIPDEEDST